MLDDVGQGLLHDSVERGLDLGGEPQIAELVLQIDVEACVLSKHVHQALDRRAETEVVERGGTQLNCEPPDVLKRRDDQLT